MLFLSCVPSSMISKEEQTQRLPPVVQELMSRTGGLQYIDCTIVKLQPQCLLQRRAKSASNAYEQELWLCCWGLWHQWMAWALREEWRAGSQAHDLTTCLFGQYTGGFLGIKGGSWVQLLVAHLSLKLKTQSKINHEAVPECPAGHSGSWLLWGWVAFLIRWDQPFSEVGELKWLSSFSSPCELVSHPTPNPRANFVSSQHPGSCTTNCCRQILGVFLLKPLSLSVICASEARGHKI